MASGLVGTAYVKVTPDTSRFGNQLANSVAAPATNAGRTITNRLGSALGSGASRVTSGLNNGFNRTFAAVSNMAANSGSRIGRGLGGALTTVLGPIGRMRDGFMSSQVAASRFSGLSGTIGGKLRSAVDLVGAGASRIGRLFQRSGKQSDAALERTRNMAGRLKQGLIGIGAAAGAGVAAIGVQAFQAAAGIQQSRAALTGLYGSGAKATDMLNRMRAIASGSPIAFSAYSKAAESLAYMGISGNKATQTIDNIGKALVGAGKGSEQMGQVTEALLNMQNQGKATAEDVNRISQAGVPAWEALATASGVSMQQIHDDVAKGKVSVNDMMGAIQGASGPTFQKLMSASSAASGTVQNVWARTKDNVITSLGFMAQGLMTKLGPALSSVGKAVSAGLQKLPQILSFVGSMLAPIGSIFANLWSAAKPFVQGFGAGFLGALVSIGVAFKTVIGPALTWVTGLLAKFSGNNAGLIKILGGVVGAIAAVVVVTKTLSLAMTAARAAMLLVNLAFAANPIGLVLVAITALVGGFIYLWNTSSSFRNFWIGIWNAIKSATMTVVNAIVGFFTQTLPAAFNAVVTWFTALPGRIWGALTAFASMVGNAVNTAIQFLLSLPGRAAYALGYLAGLVVKGAKAAWDFLWNTLPSAIAAVGSWLASLPGKVGSWLASLPGLVGNLASRAWHGFVNMTVSVASSVWGFITSIPGRIGSFLASLPGMVRNLASTAWHGFVNATISAANGVWGFIRSIPGRIMSFFGNAGSWLYDAGKWVIQGLINGITAIVRNIGSFISNIAGNIVGGFKRALGMGSPSKVMRDEVGKQIVAGVVQGINSDADKPLRSVRAMAGRMSDVAANVESEFSANLNGSTVLHNTLADAVRTGMSEATILMDGRAVAKGVDKARKVDAKR